MRAILVLSVALATLQPALADDTVHCSLDGATFYTTRPICNALIGEYAAMNEASVSVPRDQAVHRCAENLAKKLSGLDRPAYLNQCASMASALPRYRF